MESPVFIKIDNYACQSSYGKYGTRKEANFACVSNPNCKFVLSNQCLYPNDFGHFKLCDYNSSLVLSTASCVYKKEDIDRSGNWKIQITIARLFYKFIRKCTDFIQLK